MSFPSFPPFPNPESSSSSSTHLQRQEEPSNEVAEPSFICTICWQSQPRGSKPKLLGTSARIVCKDCWRAVLDLSICWVCGECIVRGDEVVSLGWCFWHRSCFGCLVCGLSIPIPADSIGGVEAGNGRGEEVSGWKGYWGAWEYEGEGRRRCVGVELSSIPLCGACAAEMEGESRGEVMRRGLDTVSRFDGGLSRERLKMFSEDGGDLRLAKGRRLQCPRKPRAKSHEMGLKGSCACPIVEDDRLPLLKNAAAMGIINESEIQEPDTHYHSDSEAADLGQIEDRPEVYVSVFDPINELPFIPSNTKPLPKWMNLFPDELNREKKRRKTEPQYYSSTLVRETTWLGAGAHFISGDGSRSSFDDSETATRKNSELPMSSALLPPAEFHQPDSATPTRMNSDLPITPPSTPFPRVPTKEIEREKKGSTEKPVHNRKRKSSSISFHPKITRDCILVEPDEKLHRHSKVIEYAASPGISTALPPRKRTPYPSIEETAAKMSSDYFGRGVIAPPSPTETSDAEARKRRSDAPSPELAPELVGKWSTTPSPDESSSPDETSSPGVVSPVPIPNLEVPLLSKSIEDIDTYQPDSPDPKIEGNIETPSEEVLQSIKEEKTRMLDKECWEERVRGREQIRRGMRCEGLEGGERTRVDKEEVHRQLRALFEGKTDVGKRGVVREEWNK